MWVDEVFRCSKSFPHEVALEEIFGWKRLVPLSYLVISIWFKADNVI